MTQSVAVSAGPSGSLARTVIAGAVGNVLEWYDFGLFGYFAPVIARQFFPPRTGWRRCWGRSASSRPVS